MWFFVSLSQSTSFSFNQCKCFWRPMSAYLSRVKALFLWTNLGPILLDRHLGDGPVLLPRFHLKKGQRARGAAGLSKARRAGAWELNSPPIKGSNVSCQGRVGDNQRYPSGSRRENYYIPGPITDKSGTSLSLSRSHFGGTQ